MLINQRCSLQQVLEYFIIIFFCLYPLLDITRNAWLFYGLVYSAVFFLFIVNLEKGYVVRKLPREALPLLFLFLWFILSSSWSNHPIHSFITGIKTFGFMIVSLLAIEVFRQKGFKSLWVISIIFSYGIFFIFFYIFLKYGAVRQFGNPEMKSFVNFFSNKGTAIIIPCVPIVLYCLKMKIFNRLLSIGALASCYISISLSESRASLVLIILATFGTIFAISENIKILFRYVCYSVIFIVLIFVVINSMEETNDLTKRVSSRFSNSALLSNESVEDGIQDYERIMMFIVAKDIIEQDPFWGVGYENFGFFMEKIYGSFVVSHNLIITTWAETGLMGLGFFVWLLLECGKNIRRQRRRFAEYHIKAPPFYGVLFVALALVLIHGMVRPQLNNPMFYLIIAACLSRPRRLEACLYQ